jgi:hypothetical protein
MKIAQRFSAGVDVRFEPESVKRTTEKTQLSKRLTQPSASRTNFNEVPEPTDESVGYYHSSACRKAVELTTKSLSLASLRHKLTL